MEDCPLPGKHFFLNLNDNRTGVSLIVFNIVLNVVLMITASLGNGLIIVAILRSQNLQTPSYLLITSLAFTDLLVGLVYHPLQIASNTYNLQGDVQGVCGMAKVYVFFSTYLAFASLLMVTCISIDRYLALTLRHRYNIIVTKKRVRSVIIFVWILTLFIAFPQTIDDRVYNNSYAIDCSLVSVLLSVISFFYIKSFRALHLYTVQVQAQQPNPLAAGNFDVFRYKKTLKTMVIVLACLLLCCVPLVCSLVVIETLGR